ncbi:MAG: undecaprenyl/decaprenyl-phosphate alpha-N-acetylglucosaminyl 1-phosphate transferase [Erysipelotrichaceae bacterium]|nr:undecaprenyl/decaprenyl-phosphate alpha-N-acetylglucosaminyl 1-phosphate transferase [Erysipelotrichaceae bacterium]MBR5048347.1 undecaprenyl/decaprenyl-phosphate alpha-N-acetylglucosaminyl 1-phosphate transferase [Erysipelotrichaceae bacterium]
MSEILYFIFPTIVSAILIIPVRMIAFKFGLYAKENNRTVHHGNIPRIGGVAIFLAFMGCSLFMLKDIRNFTGLLIGAAIIFLFGFLDDAFDLKPILKVVGQFLAATAVIFVGKVALTTINLPFGIVLDFDILSYIVTYLWIIGITNAVNLIDGLDGLAGGFSIIVLLTICMLGKQVDQTTMIPICLILAGSTMGFLFYNFHPAKIFMGDCGSQLLGCMIASISLSGFKGTTFITLFIPILLLFIPISDTFLAIIRRKLRGQKISSPDRGHLHHMLMNNMRLGQVGAVLVIYCVTALFGFTAYLYVINQSVALCVLVIIMIMFDMFIEYTGMISPKYRPILNLLDKFRAQFDSSNLNSEAEEEAEREIQEAREKSKEESEG